MRVSSVRRMIVSTAVSSRDILDMIVNGEHGVGVGEFMEMDAYVRAGRGTCGPRGNGVVMISVRSRTRRARADACPCSRSARPASRASWAPGPGNSPGQKRRARPTRSRLCRRRCRRSHHQRTEVGRWPFARRRPGRQRSRELGRAPAPGPRPRAASRRPVWKSISE